MYHPKNKVGNEYYIEHFKKEQGDDLTHFLEDICGRNTRYIIDNEEENSVTMGIEAAKKVLKKANLSAKELDMIIFASQVPEFVFPTNAVALHHALNAGNHTGILDINANCSGLTTGLDQASRNLLANPNMKRVLLVGSDAASLVMNPQDTITYPNFGDVAVALILEKTEEETGFIDSMYYTESSDFDKVTFPKNGLSKNLHGRGVVDYVQWLPFPGDVSIEKATIMIEELIHRNNLSTQDIKAYCLSQFSIQNIELLRDNLGLKDEQMVYVGDKYGYTGTTSPLLAMYEGIQDGRIKRGDTVLFWTVGIGWQLIAVLFKY
ncbi:ketoacyl-ACP synthase III [Rummeliibacillus sp. TYF005]|nr:ketoacyl-ACP synthase III [Rummeliibacillus sp. TYF005]